MSIIKVKRGLEQNVNSNLLQDGELAITTDENNLYSNKGKINRQNVYVGSSEPDDPNIDVWINPQSSDYIVDKIYPIGSIYLSVNNTSPSILFGGEWEQIKDRFLLGAGDNYAAGNTGGEAMHTLTSDEIPSHNHPTYRDGFSFTTMKSIAGSSGSLQVGNSGRYGFASNNGYEDLQVSNGTGYSGKSQSHNNMPPYLVVYVWKRIE